MSNQSSLENAVILITEEGIGSANVQLQHQLLDTYLKLLLENDSLPAAVCFYTKGAKLVVEESPFLEQLSQIEKNAFVCSSARLI